MGSDRENYAARDGFYDNSENGKPVVRRILVRHDGYFDVYIEIYVSLLGMSRIFVIII